jgi:hypothetical protein
MVYTVVSVSTYKDKFIDEINGLIERGWMPQGGVHVTAHQGSGTVTYYQAMTSEQQRETAVDATRGATEFAGEVFGANASAKLTELHERLKRRITKADVRELALNEETINAD